MSSHKRDLRRPSLNVIYTARPYRTTKRTVLNRKKRCNRNRRPANIYQSASRSSWAFRPLEIWINNTNSVSKSANTSQAAPSCYGISTGNWNQISLSSTDRQSSKFSTFLSSVKTTCKFCDSWMHDLVHILRVATLSKKGVVSLKEKNAIIFLKR